MLETTNYKLKKIELNDSPPNIEVINPNWDTIDIELKKAADLKVQYDALKVGAVNLKNFTDFNKISVLDDTTEWEKGGGGVISLRKGVNIPGIGNGLTVVNIGNSQDVESSLSTGYITKPYSIIPKPNTEYSINALMAVGTIEGKGAFIQFISRNADGIATEILESTPIKIETSFTKVGLKIKTSPATKYLQIRFVVSGKGGADFYQPMLVEGNKIVEGWSPSLADIDREIKAVQVNVDNIKLGVRNLISNGDFRFGLQGYEKNQGANIDIISGLNTITKDIERELQVIDSMGISTPGVWVDIPIPKEGNYVISYDIEGVDIYGGRHQISLYNESKVWVKSINTSVPVENGKYTRQYQVFKVDIPGNYKILIYFNPSAPNQGFRIKNIKLEYGNKATEFSPNPSDIEKTSIGVRNLLSNGDFKKGLSGWSANGAGTVAKVEIDPTGFSYLETSRHNVSNSKIRLDMIKKGDYVTVTFKARQKGTGTFTPSFYLTNPNSTVILNSKTSFVLNSAWTQYSFTFAAKNDGDPTNSIYFYGSTNDSLLMHLTDIKIELGTHPTGFIPSTEDINEVIALKESGGTIGTVEIKNATAAMDAILTSKLGLLLASAGRPGVFLESGTFRPVDAQYHLGLANYPWNIIYGKNLNLNGTLTTDTTNAGIDHLKTTKNILCLSGKVGSTVIDDTCFRPLASLKGVYDLGDLAYPWNIIYGNILKLGGTLELKSLSSTVDTINTSKGYLGLNAGDKGVVIDEVANALRPSSTSLGSISLGTAAFPFKDLFIGSYSPSLSNGYTRLPNGNIMQWGDITCKVKVGTEYTTPITFPIAFPNKAYSIVAVAKYNSRVGGTAGVGSVIVNARSTMANKTGADIITGAINSAGLSTVDNDILVSWISIGH